MHVKTIRKPGTHNLLKRFGERLVCVRYRYDPVRRKRYKTAEIILAKRIGSRRVTTPRRAN